MLNIRTEPRLGMLILPFVSDLISIHYLIFIHHRRRQFLYAPTNQLQHYLEIRQCLLQKTINRSPDQKLGVWQFLTRSFDVSLRISYTECWPFIAPTNTRTGSISAWHQTRVLLFLFLLTLKVTVRLDAHEDISLDSCHVDLEYPIL